MNPTALSEARFARDRERVLGSRAFRRLAGKTQVVALPSDPLVRTRLTHTLEVSSIARELGRGLGLIETLVDAIALAHDLGHPAFGHAGEKALAALVPGGFHHASHGVRVVTVLEPLDLAGEVVEGVLQHSKGRAGAIFVPRRKSLRREAKAVRAADLFAYACHDLDDAYLLGVLHPREVPNEIVSVLGAQPCEVRCALVARTVRSSLERGDIALDGEAELALQSLRTFLYERLYEGPRIARQTAAIRSLIESLWEVAMERPATFDAALAFIGLGRSIADSPAERFRDAVASMTDRQVVELSRMVGVRRTTRSFPTFRRCAPMQARLTPAMGT